MLKAVTVIGLDTASRGMTEADLAKQILVWVWIDTLVPSRYCFVVAYGGIV